ncbi:MAG: dipeptidase [Cyclobacteriaceae bacterium]|nr:dipeptidase [Cyclobacteriaceae bacterium]
MSNISNYKDYLNSHKVRFLDELFELLRIPSVSADSKYKQDVQRAADFVKSKLEAAGVEKVEICETQKHPIVYGEKVVDTSLPTILVYGHYDVQPADPLELWESPPFEPTIRDNRIHARGSCDDKGQFYMHVKAFETLNACGSLPCNVKFMIEGEEEIGSANLASFVKENADKLASDIILISDTSMISMEHPSITAGLKGLCYMEVEVTGPKRDLHSGTYGGAVANPVNVLCDIIARLKDEHQRITIPGFYDKVVELSEDERKKIAEAPFNLEKYKEALDVEDVMGEAGYSTVERTGIRPTLDVNGIWGGYIGEGAKTVLPSKAYAKISMRLVPDQSSKEIEKLFTDYFISLAPKGVKVKVSPHHGGEPVVTPIDSLAFKAAEEAFLEGWGKKPIPTRDGGSIPIVALFDKVLKTKSILMGFGLDKDAIHSPNESYGIDNFYKGIETIILFHKHFARIMKK